MSLAPITVSKYDDLCCSPLPGPLPGGHLLLPSAWGPPAAALYQGPAQPSGFRGRGRGLQQFSTGSGLRQGSVMMSHVKQLRLLACKQQLRRCLLNSHSLLSHVGLSLRPDL